MISTQLLQQLKNGGMDARLVALYGKERLADARCRYEKAINAFTAIYGEERDLSLFSVSGRSELSGNHTDHNHGCVIAAAIDLDIIAVAAKRNDSTIRLTSEGFPEDVVDISAFNAPLPERFSRSDALIAGVCEGFRRAGFSVGGFDAYTTSSVLKGSGLSSSAAFEDMIGNIENHFYNEGLVENATIAKIAQFAENEFFGKPCGLMDQMGCGIGGIISIDFADPANPKFEKIDFDLTAAGYALCIVDTGGNHANLTPDYAAIPSEMKAVAAALGKTVLRDVSEEELLEATPRLRNQVGDRAILRALHFLGENRRVAAQKKALAAGDLDAFFTLVAASGRSSFCYLQNVYSSANPFEQGLSLALALAEKYLAEKGGVCRVHGGGFAGTVQAYVPLDAVSDFVAYMDGVFGKGATIPLRIRPEGAIKVM